jgi:hypothetical protein
MAAVEIVSCATGAVALAGLFTTCIECFGYFESVQQFEKLYDVLLVKLDLEKTRLLAWGDAAGILDQGKKPHSTTQAIRNGTNEELMNRSLRCIMSLLTDVEMLQNRYGVRSASPVSQKRLPFMVSENSMNRFKVACQRFWSRFETDHSGDPPALLTKIKWAIHDKKQFEELIHHLKDCIDGLYELLPDKGQTHEGIISNDIESIHHLPTLKLIQAACDEGSYVNWSEKASAIIDGSQVATTDRRIIESWIEGIHDKEVLRLDTLSSLSGMFLSHLFRET